MNTFLELRKYCNEQIEKYPDLKEDINDYFELAKDETEQGGSKQHEINLCVSSIDQLINGDGD